MNLTKKMLQQLILEEMTGPAQGLSSTYLTPANVGKTPTDNSSLDTQKQREREKEENKDTTRVPNSQLKQIKDSVVEIKKKIDPKYLSSVSIKELSSDVERLLSLLSFTEKVGENI